MYKNLKKLIHYIIYIFPNILLPFFLFKRIKNQIKYIQSIEKLNYKLCELSELNKLFKKYKSKNLSIVASGSSFGELTNKDIQTLNNTFNVVFGLWDDFPFKADILFAEFSPQKIDLLHRFVNSVNKKVNTFKNTLLLVDISYDEDFKIHKLLLKKLHPSLKGKVRFIAKITSMSSSFFPRSMLRTKYLLNFLIKRNIFWHCRSSSFYGATISLFVKPKAVYLIGIDGYSGYYFNKEYIEEEAIKLNNQDSKNIIYELHSTANKKFGEPTITEAFIALSKYMPVFTISKNQLLSKYLMCQGLRE